MELEIAITNQIVEQLKPANPYKIILFGSQATGKATKDSDIDLMVVLDRFHIENTSKEQFEIYRYIKNLLLDTNRQYPIDLIIYSRDEFHQNKEIGSSFLEVIERTGKTLYEKRN